MNAPGALPASRPADTASTANAMNVANAHAGGASVFERIAARPGRFSLFHALRLIERAHPELPALGDALRPGEEPVRFAGEPALDFAPGAISRLEPRAEQAAPRLVQRVLGLFGPNGALPVHLTEYARERAMHHGDRTFAAFADMLLHRFGLFFYRAWARANPAVSLDRGHDAPAVRQVGALIGLAEPALRERDALGDFAKLHFAGRLARSVRDADGLQAWIAARFGVPVRVEQFSGHWMPLARDERTRLGCSGATGRAGARVGAGSEPSAGAALGAGAVLGGAVWDVQHKFRIVIGPLDWVAFQRFLPGAPQLDALQALVRQYVGFEFAWDLQLVPHDTQVPDLRIGRQADIGRLGRSAWLKGPCKRTDRLIMNVESIRRAPLRPSLAAGT